MAEDTITFTAKAEQLIKENERILKNVEKLEKKFQDLKKKNKEAANAAKGLSKETVKGLKEIQTPQEKYIQNVRRLKAELAQGLITEKQYLALRKKEATAVKMATAEKKKATAATRENTSELKKNSSAAQRSSGFMSGLGKSVLAYGSTVIGVTSLVRLFNSELEKQEELRQKSKDATLTKEQGLQFARANFVADETIGAADFDDAVSAAAAEVKVPTSEFARALADALSAKGSLSNQVALDITKAAFEASPNKEGFAARELAQSAGDFAKLGGSQSPEAVIGFLAQSQQAARITDIAKLGQAAFPAAQAGVQSGDTIEQAQELFLSLNNLVGDAMGRISSTGTIALIEQLNEFEPTQNLKGATAKLAALQSDPKLAQQFLDDTSFEKKVLPGVRSLVTGDARGLEAQQTVREKIGSLDKLEDPRNIAAFKTYIKFVQGTGAIGGVLRNAELDANRNVEEFRVGGKRSVISEIEDIVNETLENVNLSGPDFIAEYGLKKRMQLVATAAQRGDNPDVAFREAESLLVGQLLGFNRTDEGKFVRNPNASDVKSEPEREFIIEQVSLLRALKEEVSGLRQDNANQRPKGKNPADRLNKEGQ